MPFTRAALLRAPSLALTALWRLLDALLVVAVVGIGLFAALLLLVRFVVFPHIERYRDTIVDAVAAQVHQPVTAGALATGWDGWNPKLVIESLRVGAPGETSTLLELPRLELTVAWTSLPLRALHLKQLVIDGPRLAVRRDRQGIVHVAGMEFDPTQPSDDLGFTDWLLRQREIVIRNGLVTWTDEQRDAPQLVLDDVQFRLESAFGRHRFGLRGRPPAELAAPIDVRGELGRTAMRDWKHADGKLYVRLDYADLGAWREWLPLPVDVASGKGALRAWFTFESGEAREVIADVELAELRTRLAPELPELALAHVTGRTGWRFGTAQREVFARQLAFSTPTGERLEPTDLTAQVHLDARAEPQRGRLEFDRLELAPLRAIAAQLPLPVRWREDLRRFAPSGRLTRGTAQWEGPADAPTAFDVATEFAEFSIAPVDAWPGLTGLSGSLKANAQGGAIKASARSGALRIPHVLAAPVALDSANGEIAWTVRDRQVDLRVDELTFANADAAGRLRGTYRHVGSGPGEIDLDVTLTRAAVQAVPRYVPVFVPAGVHDWLARALKPGTVDETKLKLKGNLAQFPFADRKSGIFTVDVKAHGLGLDYAPGWPALSDVDGEVHFHGPGVTVVGSRGRVSGVTLSKVTVDIPELRHPVLDIAGEAAGATRDFLRFVAESPVAGWTDNALAAAETAGDGRLGLKIALPLADVATRRVSGEFQFMNNQVKLPDVPALGQVNGRILFTERDLSTRELVAEALGGPVKVAIARGAGRLHIAASGNASVAAVTREFEVPLAERFAGNADWTFTLDNTGDATRWVLESPLKGATSDLPAPLRKGAAETMPLRVERVPTGAGGREDTIAIRVRDLADIAVRRRLRDDVLRADAVAVTLGRTAMRRETRATRPGLWIRAELPDLDVDQWLAVKQTGTAATATGAGGPKLAGIDLDVGALTAFGRRFSALKASGTAVQDDWKLELNGEQIAGTATWSAPSTAAPNGRVVARLARFAPPPAKPAGPEAPDTGDASASAWPELDVTADTLVSASGRELGRMELVAKPRSAEWRIERLVLANDGGRVDANGAWRPGGKPEETRVDIALDVKDADRFLARFGHGGAVQGAPTKITGQLAWRGAPSDFDYETLSGAFRIEVGSGRFMKVHPGIGKLLGVLSLQALPRRIGLDFRDVFSEGFTFDRITGNVRIARGIMSTEDLRLSGPSAQVAIAGDTDLEQETQRLKVRVQPTLSAGVSAGAALLFLANPIVGAAVGAGSLLAQKVLRDPVEQIFSYQYSVTGSWSDPQVARAATVAANSPAETPAK